MSNDAIYSIARDGKTIGQFTLPQIKEGLKAGQLKVSDFYWVDGMRDWAALSILAKKFSDAEAAAALEKIKVHQQQEAAQLAAKRETERSLSAAQKRLEEVNADAAKAATSSGHSVNVPVGVGSSLVFLGGFMPMLSAPVFSGASMSLIGNGTGETAVCAFFAARTAMHAFNGLPAKVAHAFWAGVALLAIPLLKFIYLLIKMSAIASRMRGGASRVADEGAGSSGWSFDYNPFDGVHLSLIEILPIPLNLGVGFGCILLGTVILYKSRR